MKDKLSSGTAEHEEREGLVGASIIIYILGYTYVVRIQLSRCNTNFKAAHSCWLLSLYNFVVHNAG